MERSEGVDGMVVLGEGELELDVLSVDPEAPVAVLEHGVRGIEPAELDVGAVEIGLELGAARGDDGRTARR